MNPLLQDFKTLHNTIPFNDIEFSHFKEAFELGLNEAKEEIRKLKTDSSEPTFENTIEALEYQGERLGLVSSIFFNLLHAESDSKMEDYAQEISPELSKISNDITLDKDIFDRVKAVYDKKDSLSLNHEQYKLLEENYKSFVRNGALLSESEKEKIREIDTKLSTLSLEFGKRVLADTNAYILHITDQSDLAGLPDSSVQMAKEEAKERDLEGWVFTLKYPSYIPFMKYAENRELREKITKAFGSVAFKGDENDNQGLVKEIASLRYDRANLLGFDTHADYVLQKRMAKSPHTVTEFLNKLLDKAKPRAVEELDELKVFAKDNGLKDEFMPWDSAFYTEKLKMAKYDFDDEVLKPYLSLEKCMNGLFSVANKLYGIELKRNDEIQTYHQDVMPYEVYDEKGDFLAVFYVDLFPRSGKKQGAWATDFITQKVKEGVDHRPHVAIVCNFSRPVGDDPALLTHNELTTLYHEFGHALHMMMSKCQYASFAGANVHWDFVELPSQVMENWCFEKDCLDLFAKNHKTGEEIPQVLIEKLKKSQTFMEGRQTLRQLSLGLLDMSWHGGNPKEIENVGEHEQQAMAKSRLLPSVEGSCITCSFSHLFQGGYSAGYYSYKWAEVLDADAFEYFKEEGIFDKAVAAKFKENILEKGGTLEPEVLYKNFRGREPNEDALLRRAGLL